MATYVVLFNWTEQGIRNVKETTKRYDAAIAAADKMGVRIQQLLYTMGPYDFVGICEAKDEQSFNAFCLATGAQGNVRSTTMRAFTVDEMKGILTKF